MLVGPTWVHWPVLAGLIGGLVGYWATDRVLSAPQLPIGTLLASQKPTVYYIYNSYQLLKKLQFLPSKCYICNYSLNNIIFKKFKFKHLLNAMPVTFRLRVIDCALQHKPQKKLMTYLVALFDDPRQAKIKM
jgi:hypothetical protein